MIEESLALSEWDRKRIQVQREIIASRNLEAIRKWAEIIGLRHWHTLENGVIVGELSPHCYLCRQEVCPELSVNVV